SIGDNPACEIADIFLKAGCRNVKQRRDQLGRPAETNTREQRFECKPAQFVGRSWRCFQGFPNLGLQPGLLMKTDLKISHQNVLRQLDPVVRLQLISLKRESQPSLAFGWIAVAQAVLKGLEFVRLDRDARWTQFNIARKLQADFFEHLFVASRHGVTGQLESIQRSMNRMDQPAKPSVGPEQTAAHQPCPE